MSAQTEDTGKLGPLSPTDPSSFSNPDKIRTDNFHLHWSVNFRQKTLTGSVTHHLVRVEPTATQVVFDTRFLNVKSVHLLSDKTKLEFSLGEEVLTFGKPLTVTLPQGEQKLVVVIDYETTPESSGLQWLEKEQTAGKSHPFLFSQCEPIHARSLFPCQDTPSVKCTYTADVVADSDLTVLMSGVRTSHSESVEDLTVDTVADEHVHTQKRHKFLQKIPIPSYLVAIVVGKMGSKKVGPRSTVWAEPMFVDAAAYDFSETEDMLQAAEKLMGEYVWGIYDIVVLPPSFPFGGMENPCITFATPTLLAGDKSLANVIAHEIAHSWTGNLVTNSTFEHFWLNEGFTVYTERMILGALKGEKFRQFQAIGGWKTLKETVHRIGETSPLTRLVPDLSGIDPDDAFSSIPYENGFAFLYYLSEKVGGPEVFQEFLREYIKKFKLTSIDTSTFKQMFLEYFDGKGIGDLVKDVDWDAWLYTPGMPPVKNTYDTTLADACTELANRWILWDSNLTPNSPFSKEDLNSFSILSNQLELFLDELLDSCRTEPFPLYKAQAMEAAYGFNSMRNCEIRLRWIRLCLKAQWKDQVPLAFQFVNEQGRMKYTRPVYRDLYAWEEVRAQTIDNFQKHRADMMSMSEVALAKDLHLDH